MANKDSNIHLTTVRVPRPLYHLIKRQAQQNLRSISNEIVILTKIGLAHTKKETQTLQQANKVLQEDIEP